MEREYRYIRASRSGAESVEFDLKEARTGQYVTTCVVSVQRLLCGARVHPCGDGRDLELNDSHAGEVLRLIQKERNAIKHSSKLKTLEGWRDSGLNLDEFLAVGDEVDEALVDEQMNCVPPHILKHGYLQVGEPYNQEQDEKEQWRSTWCTFAANGSKWTYCGHCFSGDTVNRVTERDRVKEAINSLRARRNSFEEAQE